MPPLIVYLLLGLGTVFGITRKAPAPSTDYKFTTAETCPFYQDAHGNMEVEPFVVCPKKQARP